MTVATHFVISPSPFHCNGGRSQVMEGHLCTSPPPLQRKLNTDYLKEAAQDLT